MKPAESPLRKTATRTDVIAGTITAVILVITTAWLVILLF